MADYRILDERDRDELVKKDNDLEDKITDFENSKNTFKAGNKLNIEENGNEIIYSHIGEVPTYTTATVEQPGTLNWGEEYRFQIPYAYDNFGHVATVRDWVFQMPEEPTDTGSGLEELGVAKHYGWSDPDPWEVSTTVSGDGNEKAGTNFEELSWGDKIRIPNFEVDDYGRVVAGFTAGYKLPENNVSFKYNILQQREQIDSYSKSYTFDVDSDFYIITIANIYGYSNIDYKYLAPITITIPAGVISSYPAYFYTEMSYTSEAGVEGKYYVLTNSPTVGDNESYIIHVSANIRALELEILSATELTSLTTGRIGIIDIIGVSIS